MVNPRISSKGCACVEVGGMDLEPRCVLLWILIAMINTMSLYEERNGDWIGMSPGRGVAGDVW